MLLHPMVHVCGVLGAWRDSCCPSELHPLPIQACHLFLHPSGSLRVASCLPLSQALVSITWLFFGHGLISPSAFLPTQGPQ